MKFCNLVTHWKLELCLRLLKVPSIKSSLSSSTLTVSVLLRNVLSRNWLLLELMQMSLAELALSKLMWASISFTVEVLVAMMVLGVAG